MLLLNELRCNELCNAPRRTRTSNLRFRKTPCAFFLCEFPKEFSGFGAVDPSVMLSGLFK